MAQAQVADDAIPDGGGEILHAGLGRTVFLQHEARRFALAQVDDERQPEGVFRGDADDGHDSVPYYPGRRLTRRAPPRSDRERISAGYRHGPTRPRLARPFPPSLA